MNVTEINKNRDYIPEEVLDNINPNEKILFRLRSSHISKSTKVSAIAFICVAIFGVVVIFFILSLLAKDPDLDIINIIFILVLIGVVILMIYNAIPSLHRKIQYLILTNKNFYFQINDRKEHRQFYNLMDNNSLITITYDINKRKDPEQNHDGKLKIMGLEREFVIYNIPNIIENFKTIESIGYHYGNFKDRGEKIKDKFKLPYKVENFDKSLIINEKGVVYSEENIIENIPFNETFWLGYSNKLRYSTLTKKYELLGTIMIKSSYPSLTTISFECEENFIDILELIYLNFTVWKENKSLLFSLDKLLRERKKDTSAKKFELKPTIRKEQLSPQLSNLLEEDEEILFHYIPKFKYKNNIIFIVAGISLIIINILQFVFLGITDTFFLSAGFFIGSIVAMTFLIFICCWATTFLGIKIKSNKSSYIFTNQQIIMWILNNFYFIPFSNIATITHLEERTGYNVEIKLKKSMQIGINPNADDFLIPIRPKEQEILDKIKSFKNII